MRSQVEFAGRPLTTRGAAGAIRLAGGETLDRFLLLDQARATVDGGTRHTLRAIASGRVEQATAITLPDRFPGLARVRR